MSRKARKAAIEEWRNPRILTFREAAELLEAQDIDRAYYAFVRAICQRMNVRCSYGRRNSKLTLSERCVLSAVDLHNDVFNGGFSQYLMNYTLSEFRLAKALFEQIGATIAVDCVATIAEALPVLQDMPDNDSSLLAKIIEQSEILDRLDRLYYDSYGGTELDQLLTDFIIANREDFAEPGDEIVKQYRSYDRISEVLGTVTDDLEDVSAALEELTIMCHLKKMAQQDQVVMEIRELLKSGRRLSALRMHREYFKSNLQEASKAIADLSDELIGQN